MASELNKKQQQLLRTLSQDDLIGIIHDLIRDNKHAKATLLNDHLLSAPDKLKAIEKEYNKQAKSKRFYDYYDADTFYHSLILNIAKPLEMVAEVLPEPAEILSSKILLEFETFSQKTDTSSGSWMDYYSVILEVWLKALVKQKNMPPQLIAQKIMEFIRQELYFGFEVIKRYQRLLGTPIIRALRDIYHQKQSNQEAVTLSILIKDMAFLKVAVQNKTLYLPEHYLDYAKLLIDEVRADEAIELLEYMLEQGNKQYAQEQRWNELYINALIEKGRREEAKTKCLSAFSCHSDPLFYRLYTQLHDNDDESLHCFLRIAEDKGLNPYICFAAEIERFDLINTVIINASNDELADTLAYFTSQFIRALSSTLYKHGFALSATLLRRFLVESTIEKAQSKYYSHAASDMKKAIDYGKGLAGSSQFTDTLTYLNLLYLQHKRKTSLWLAMAERIKGLSIRQEGIRFIRQS